MKVLPSHFFLLTLPFSSSEFKLFMTRVPADEQVPETIVDGQNLTLLDRNCLMAPYTIEYYPANEVDTVSVRFMTNGNMGKCKRMAP